MKLLSQPNISSFAGIQDMCPQWIRIPFSKPESLFSYQFIVFHPHFINRTSLKVFSGLSLSDHPSKPLMIMQMCDQLWFVCPSNPFVISIKSKTIIYTPKAGEGNGNPLQYSCLENPMDRGAWWAAVYEVAQSWTRLKWLSNNSSKNRPKVCIGIYT